jgi:hypothetical protein
MPKVSHEFQIQFLARLMVNNHEDALAASAVTLQGQQKLRNFASRHSTHGTDEPEANSLTDLKSFMKEEFSLILQSTMLASSKPLKSHETRNPWPTPPMGPLVGLDGSKPQYHC